MNIEMISPTAGGSPWPVELKMRSNPSALEVSSQLLVDKRTAEAEAFTTIDLMSMPNSVDKVFDAAVKNANTPKPWMI